MIFFAGGDQYKYLQYWADTPLQTVIQDKLATVTVGGTSAGMAILGGHIYSAAEGSVYSDESMENPFNKFISIAPAFLRIPYMQNVLTDTHFSVRDRMGRYLTFLARVMTDNGVAVHGMACDEQTAVLLDVNTGAVEVVGVGHAYLCTPSHNPQTCIRDTPLTFTGTYTYPSITTRTLLMQS